MKPNTESNVTVLSRGVHESIAMRIDQAAMAHIMDQLINLYTNQRLAVVREYSTNARDAMVESGRGDLPIEVTTPTHESPYLTIKDTGLGMSYEDMRDTYAAYGTSTKRESDAVNGMLGFGSKSGLTYTSQFQVIAIKNGLKVQALVAKDDEGVGTIEIMDERTTDDHNGVTIKIPVPASDFHRIANVCTDFYQYWAPGTVLLDGSIPTTFREQMQIDEENGVWLDDWTYVKLERYGGGEHKVIMGDVAYPIKLPNLQVHVGVTAWVNMGDVAFTPSREGLKDNEKRTVKTATELAAHVNERLPVVMLERINAANVTPWERYEMAYKWSEFLPRKYRQDMSAAITIQPGRQAWKLGGSHDVERRAERLNVAHLLSSLAQSPRTHVIVDYPHNNVSGSIKRRLAKMTDDGARTQWYLLPNGTDVSTLEGRSHLHTFDQLPEADKTDRPQREKREGGYKYNVIPFAGASYETEKVEEDGPLFYGTPDKGRWSSTQQTYMGWARQLQGDYVELTPRQVEKFLRLHPWATEITVAYNDARALAEASVTEADRVAIALRSDAVSYGFNSYEPIVDMINDPDFKAAIEASISSYDSPTLTEAERFGVYIGAPTIAPTTDLSKIVNRYPLLTFDRYGRTIAADRIDDIVLYVNAKFATLP